MGRPKKVKSDGAPQAPTRRSSRIGKGSKDKTPSITKIAEVADAAKGAAAEKKKAAPKKEAAKVRIEHCKS